LSNNSITKINIFEPIVPITISSFLGLIFAYYIKFRQSPLEAVPFSEKEQGIVASGLNAIFYVLISLLTAYLIVYLLRKNKFLFFKLLMGGAFFFSSFIITLYLFVSIFPENELLEVVYLFSSLILSTIISLSAVSSKIPLEIRNIIMIFLGSILGFFLGFNIPTWSVIAILIGMSLYDIFAVKKGPIKTIINIIDSKEGEEELPFLGYTASNWQLGLGDLVFYTLLVSHITVYFGLIEAFASLLGVLIGSMLTFYFLQREKMLPGLPIAIFLGLAFLGVYELITHIVSFLF